MALSQSTCHEYHTKKQPPPPNKKQTPEFEMSLVFLIYDRGILLHICISAFVFRESSGALGAV